MELGTVVMVNKKELIPAAIRRARQTLLQAKAQPRTLELRVFPPRQVEGITGVPFTVIYGKPLPENPSADDLELANWWGLCNTWTIYLTGDT